MINTKKIESLDYFGEQFRSGTPVYRQVTLFENYEYRGKVGSKVNLSAAVMTRFFQLTFAIPFLTEHTYSEPPAGLEHCYFYINSH